MLYNVIRKVFIKEFNYIYMASSQTISVGDFITNSVNKFGTTFEAIVTVTFAVNSAMKTIATITTATQTIIKDIDLITLSQQNNSNINTWVVGQ